MTITIDVSPEAEIRLRAEAAQKGQDLDTYVGQVVTQRYHVPLMTEVGRRAWEAIFDELLEGDADEQRETLAILEKALDEDRPGQRRVFGPGMNPPADVQ